MRVRSFSRFVALPACLILTFRNLFHSFRVPIENDVYSHVDAP